MMAPLRFCFLTTFYPPYGFGGDAIDVERLAHALIAHGHAVTVVHDIDAYRALARGVEPAARLAGDGVEVISLRSRLGALSPFLTHQFGRPVVHGRRLARLFRDRTFDVVTFHNISLVGGPAALALGGDAVRIYVAHEHWLVCPTHVLWRHNREACDRRECLRCVLRHRRPPQLWRYAGSLERHLSHVDAFVARSEFSRQKHHEFGFPRTMEVLPVLPPEDDAAAALEESPHPRPYFLFVGRLERVKGLDTIIPACATYPDADLVVVGDGTESSALRALAAGSQRIRFTGRLPNADLGRYYRHAIATIVPSVGFETFGVVLVESLRRGVPVIARRRGPLPEIVEQSNGGELFDDEAGLLSAMRRLQHDTRYRSVVAQRGAEASRSRWSQGAVVARYLDIVAQAGRARAARLGRPLPSWVARIEGSTSCVPS